MPPKAPCGNPLYLKWIEELRDQAREKGSKAYESYSKAARSLASCPVTYTRPRDLVVLVGFGPKTVGILETKWRKHCEENGLPIPGSPPKRPAPARKKQKDNHGVPRSGSESPVATGSEAEDIPAPPPKKRKPAKPKTYIPQRGSGGYGILLGLVLAIERPEINTQVFLTKSEVIRGAQPYSDASYDHSEKGTYFTAWNSMKTLVNKGYVYVTGNPHKYCLTEEGYDVACVIRGLVPEFAHVQKSPFLHEPTDTRAVAPVRPISSKASLPPSTSAIRQLPTPPPAVAESSTAAKRRTSGGKFQFWYIDALGKRVDQMQDATVRLDPTDFITLRKIEFLEEQKAHGFVSQLRLVDAAAEKRNGHETLYGYIEEEVAPPRCSRFEAEPVVAAPSRKPTPIAAFPTPISDGEDDDWVGLPGKSAPRVAKSGGSALGTQSMVLQPAKKIAPAVSSSNSTGSIPRGPRLSSHVQPAHPLAESSTTSDLPDFDPSKAIIFPAGSYEIRLILDTREIESKSNRDRFAEKLADKGIDMETRALRLGDVCWIAKRLDGLGGEEDECVLDYVLERKRLDDLCSSIRDGRYHEQCFRLSNSGIANVFYLVEDWQTSHHMEFSGAQIMTAKSQLQVHNRFILKETHKLSESIDFLATMTGVIKKRLAGSDLHVIPTRYLSRSSYLPLRNHLKSISPTTVWHTSFQAYQDINDKSASTTLRDKWARMLMCVKGMSAERTSAVIDEFDTPRAMWDALKAHVREKRRLMAEESLEFESMTSVGSKGKGKGKGKEKVRGPDLFFADRIQGEGRRKIGDALSRELYKVFMGEHGEALI